MVDARMDAHLGVDVSDISRNIKKFRDETKKGFKSIEQNATRLGKSFDMLARNAARFGTVLLGMVSARTIFRLSRETTDFADAIGKSAENLGVSTEWLSKWRYAAELAAVQGKTFDTAIQRATRRLEQFRRDGTGEAAAALDILGGNLKEAVQSGQTMEQLLPQIAAQMRKLAKPAQLLAGMKLFDTEGVPVATRMLSQSAEALEKTLEEAAKSAPIVTQEMAKGAAAANDAMSKLRGQWAAFKQEAFTLSEQDLWWIDALADIVSDMRKMSQARRGGATIGPNYAPSQGTLDLLRGTRPAPAPQPGTGGAPFIFPDMTSVLPKGTGEAGIFGLISGGLDRLDGVLESAGEKMNSWYESVEAGAQGVAQVMQETTAELDTEYTRFVESFQVTTETVLSATRGLIEQFSAGVANAFARAIVYGEDLGEALLATLKESAANLISTLIQLAIQQLLFLALSISTIAKRTSAELASWASIVYAAAFAASASTGPIGLAAAPGVAALAVTKMLSGSAISGKLGAALGSSIPTLADGGIITGPTLALLGEGGHSERVQPLDGSEQGYQSIEVYLDGDVIARKVVERVPGVLRVDTRMQI